MISIKRTNYKSVLIQEASTGGPVICGHPSLCFRYFIFRLTFGRRSAPHTRSATSLSHPCLESGQTAAGTGRESRLGLAVQDMVGGSLRVATTCRVNNRLDPFVN
jgi:hypothetical protein